MATGAAKCIIMWAGSQKYLNGTMLCKLERLKHMHTKICWGKLWRSKHDYIDISINECQKQKHRIFMLTHVIMPKHAQLTFATMAKEKSIYFLFM